MPAATQKQIDQREVFDDRVRKARQGRRLSQEGLAHAARLDRSYVGRVERGERNVTLENIYRLAEALGVEAGSLL